MRFKAFESSQMLTDFTEHQGISETFVGVSKGFNAFQGVLEDFTGSQISFTGISGSSRTASRRFEVRFFGAPAEVFYGVSGEFRWTSRRFTLITRA